MDNLDESVSIFNTVTTAQIYYGKWMFIGDVFWKKLLKKKQKILLLR